MKIFLRGLLVLFSIGLLWQGLVTFFYLPPYILPAPLEVIYTTYLHANLIFHELLITIMETLIGLFLGTLLGCSAAFVMVFFKPFRLWLFPILIISQAIPTFAIAPLLVIWFGYGIASKIATTIIMVFFPITSAFFDGLRSTSPEWIDLAKTMNAKKWRFFWYIRIPAALPSLASGLRVATAVAPIGAVIGEWVGASQGLGFLMLNANARMQIDLMFSGLFALVLFSLLFYFLVDTLLRLLIPWQRMDAS
ncbi:MAG: Binding-protein-dependent transport system inner membrane component [uncultured bacterium]|nr:MAG: Binding-protein-dependent transport system inner membrane component [uncultured bacterium]